jgi:hypothetical protein
MSKIFGYGEDSITLWTLKQHISKILGRFHDETAPSKCLTFYRPNFGRGSRKAGSAFGEFDAVVVSSKNVYLIESKWDTLRKSGKRKITLKKPQKLRHEIFSWYLMHWDKKYRGHWERFVEEHREELEFGRKTMPPKNSILAANLEFILTKSLEQCKTISRNNIKNVLLFFYNAKKPRKPPRIDKPFKLIPIDYSKDTKDNFVVLYDEERRLSQLQKNR